MFVDINFPGVSGVIAEHAFDAFQDPLAPVHNVIQLGWHAPGPDPDIVPVEWFHLFIGDVKVFDLFFDLVGDVPDLRGNVAEVIMDIFLVLGDVSVTIAEIHELARKVSHI